jgi:peptide/nickel transport system ATP-binding protein
MTNIVEIQNLSVAFRSLHGPVHAVDDVSFAIPAGKITALVGESGSGKSVIANTIMRLLPDSASIGQGRILLNDCKSQTPSEPLDLLSLPAGSRQLRAIRGSRIGMIFQEPMTSLSPLHTIGDQISEVLRLHRNAGKKEAMEATEAMLAKVGFPNPARAISQYPFELSGGLRQRAMIAMALICGPDLLIADEPTTALDVTIQAQILTLIRDLQRDFGMSVLMITHDLGVVANIADYVVVAYRGRLMESGPVSEVFADARHDYLKALFRAVPVIGRDRSQRLQPLRPIEVGRGLAKGGSTVNEMEQVAPGETLLEISQIEKTYVLRKTGRDKAGKGKSTIRALDRINLELRKGECVGLVGESGCGKTTLSKIIVGALKPDSGSVLFHEAPGRTVDLAAISEQEWRNRGFRKRIQFVFQDPFGSLNPRMPAFDLITEPFVIQKIGDRSWYRERAVELMHLVGLDPRKLSAYPHSFSGGQRQRLGIARALALHPELLLCDEPVSALDVSVQAQILNLLKDLQAELGLSYLFISHNLAVVDYIADRIAVMCKGVLVEVAERQELFNNPVHPYTKALLAAVPEPRLDRKLDFELIRQGGQNEPSEWPAPFTINDNNRPGWIKVGGNHMVRAQA